MGIGIQPNSLFNPVQSQLDLGFTRQAPTVGSNSANQCQWQTSYQSPSNSMAGVLVQSLFTMFNIMMNVVMRLISGQSQINGSLYQTQSPLSSLDSSGGFDSIRYANDPALYGAGVERLKKEDGGIWGTIKSFGSKLLNKAGDLFLGSDSGSGIFGWIKNIF